MQKFFSTTIISKFIKYLLMNTPIPTCSYIEDYGTMVQGGLYAYRGNIYRCTKTGLFRGTKKSLSDYVYCSESVLCTDSGLVVTDSFYPNGGSALAKYDIVCSYIEGEYIMGIADNYISKVEYYDTDTHHRLGEYLRFLRSTYGLNLMSLYNCFSNYYVENIDISTGKLTDNFDSTYKVALVPVKFNHTYTIAMNSDLPIYIKPVIYNGKLIKSSEEQGYMYDTKYTTIRKVGKMSINQPITITTSNTDTESQIHEKWLYLAIQIPAGVTTPIVVLEGEYKAYSHVDVFDEEMFDSSLDSSIDKICVHDISLLNMYNVMNCSSISYPFADRLVEYLVQHTIDVRENISENVERVTDKFGYSHGYEGSWSNNLRCKIFNNYIKLKDRKFTDLNYSDILGYIDSDVEDALNKGWLKYG